MVIQKARKCNYEKNLKNIFFAGEELNESHVAARVNGFVGGYGVKADFEAEWEKLGLNEKMAEYIRDQHRKNFRGSN